MISRRVALHLLALAAASPLALRPGSVLADPHPAAEPGAPTPEPVVYPFQIGAIEAYSIQDGVFALPSIQPMLVPEASPKEIAKIMQEYFLAPDTISLSLNVLLLKLADGWTLIDAGAGSAFGGAGGRLARGLRALGVAPNTIRRIIITHAHGDHVGGLFDSEGAVVFSSAEIVVSAKEHAFWTAETPATAGMQLPEEGRAETVATAKRFFSGAAKQLRLVEAGKLTDEIELTPTPGHTPGHSCVLIRSGGERLLHISDAVHAYPLQFKVPQWTMAYDVDPAQAVKSRRALFQRAIKERTRVHGFHLPFPGIGHIRAVGSAYDWLPQPWNV